MDVSNDCRITQVVANDWVTLSVDLPELGLAAGQTGRVVSTWFYPNTAFEVEFAAERGVCTRRVLLLEHQIAPATGGLESGLPSSTEVYCARSCH
jgi:hypothetical protein